MRVLIAGTIGPLQSALVARLSRVHDVRVADPQDPGADLSETGPAETAAGGVDAVIFSTVEDPSAATPSDRLYRAPRAVYNLMMAARQADRFILLSSLRIFERYPVTWRVNEDWRPCPDASVEDLAIAGTEAVLREGVRVLPLAGIVLRLADVTRDASARDPRAVHIDDVVAATERALEFTPGAKDSAHGWWPFHITGAGSRSRFTPGQDTRQLLGYAPVRDVSGGLLPTQHERPRPIPPGPLAAPTRVVVFGAFGPLGSAVAAALQHEHRLRLTDVIPIDEAMKRPPFNRGAPTPRRLPGPHEYQVVDVTNPDEVAKAAEGMDAIVNLSCLRSDPGLAFRVNAVGAYNVMSAAVQHGIRRVVHTGPEIISAATTGRSASGYWADFDIPSQVPPRTGTLVYFVSKLIGLEICRIFAEEYQLDVPALLYGNFRNPDDADDDILDGFPICVSWRDGAQAVRKALTAPALPRPFEIMTIVADLPHGKVRNREAKELLGWQPQDRFARYWMRDFA